MRTRIPLLVGAVIVLAGLITLAGSMFVVNEWEQVIVLQFGDPIGAPITKPGLHFKKPFIQNVQRLSKLVLEWDGEPKALYTGGKGQGN